MTAPLSVAAAYQHILAPIDLRVHSALVLSRAQQIAATHHARLTILHVVEYLPLNSVGDTVVPTPLEITEDLARAAKTRLASLCADHVPDVPARQLVVVGHTQEQILRAAEQDEPGAPPVDLIVIGSHERHGLRALFDHTEDAVLHRASCDVLAVHLPD